MYGLVDERYAADVDAGFDVHDATSIAWLNGKREVPGTGEGRNTRQGKLLGRRGGAGLKMRSGPILHKNKRFVNRSRACYRPGRAF